MTAAAARVSSRADAAASDAANDVRGEVTKIPGVSKATAAKAVKNGYYHFIVDIWITDFNFTEFGLYKRTRNRAKSRQFTSDMDIFAEVIEGGERTGLIGYREDLWEKAENKDKRLVFKLFNESLNWRATMDLMIGRSLQQTIASRGMPVMTYSVNTAEDNFIVYLERSANKWPLMPENFGFFIMDTEGKPQFYRIKRDLINLGGDYTLYRSAGPQRRPSRRQGVLHRRQVEGQGARRACRPPPAHRAAAVQRPADLQRRQPPPHEAAVEGRRQRQGQAGARCAGGRPLQEPAPRPLGAFSHWPLGGR